MVLAYLFIVEDGGHSTHVESREQPTGVCPLLPPRGSRVARLSNECLYPLSHPPGPWSWLSSVRVLGQHIYTALSVNTGYLQRAAEETDSPGRLRGGKLGDQRDYYSTLYTL